MGHILLDMAYTYAKRNEIIPPVDFYYDKQVGAWLSRNDHSLLIKNNKFPKIGTKKFDVETGEDNKGQ